MIKTVLKGSLEKGIEGDKVYKFNRYGYEDISEALVSELESHIEGLSYIDYFLDIYSGRPCCFSYSFRKKCRYEVTLYDILRAHTEAFSCLSRYKGLDLLKSIEDSIYSITGLEIHEYLGTMFKLDTLVLNEDRHMNNIIFWREGGQYSLAPIFDNGYSLLYDTIVYPVDYPYIEMVDMPKSRPFSESFEQQVSWFFDTPKLVIDVKGLNTSIKNSKGNMKSFLGERYACYERALNVLDHQLGMWEGSIWVPK